MLGFEGMTEEVATTTALQCREANGGPRGALQREAFARVDEIPGRSLGLSLQTAGSRGF